MQHEPGDEYLRRLATFIRTNEKSLAEAGLQLRRRPQQKPGQKSDAVSVFNPLGWFGYDATSQAGPPPPKPITLTLDTHRLFYVLMRLEALGIDVGTLDVQIDSPSRPMSYINVLGDADKSETMSMASIRTSLSAVSGLSLGGGWWGKPEPPSLDSELKYIYSSFTKVPALSIHAPGKKGIAELANEPPNQNALPLDAFKTLNSLECVDIDPRTLLGWDKLAESLRSLKIKKSGLEDVTDIFVGAVVDDQARREGSTSRKRKRRIPRGIPQDAESTFFTTRLPDTVVEDTDGEESAEAEDEAKDKPTPDDSSASIPPSPSPPLQLSSLKWAFLKHLSLSDNSLTFFPTEPIQYLTSLTHLDLSSNLLVSVPPGLGGLYNLVSLNLADNMIDSVLGIYTNLGQVLHLNLAKNRLESICGLERLTALERVDLRGNYIEESAEIGRLAVLPNIIDVRIEGNPFIEIEENPRVACFDYFWKEGKTVKLDGTEPGFYEKKNLTQPPSAQMTSTRPPSVAYSPPVVAVNHTHMHSPGLPATTSVPPRDGYPTPPSSNASPYLGPSGVAAANAKARRKKTKRIVDLDGAENSDGRGSFHSRERSDTSSMQKRKKPTKKPTREPSPQPPPQVRWVPQRSMTDEPEEMEEEVDNGLLAPGAIDRTSSTATVTPTTSNITITPATPSPEKAKATPRSRHGRYQTEFIPSTASTDFNNDDTSFKPSSFGDESIGVSPKGSGSMRLKGQRAGTMGRSAARKNRVSASVYEPPTAPGEGSGIDEARDNADAYRKRLEALKQDMGDNWLKVFAQSQLRPLSP